MRAACATVHSLRCTSRAGALKPRDAVAGAVGFVGVVFVVRPDGSHSNWLGRSC
jgi:hypothetical protein